MVRLTVVPAIVTLLAVRSSLADQVAVNTQTDPFARIEALEKMAAEQGRRLTELQAQAERVAQPPVHRVYESEVRKIVAELMADAEFRESLFPSALNAGYSGKRGFYIDSADKAFSLNMKGYIQFRYDLINRQTDNPRLPGRQKQDDINAFEIERYFLIFFGHIESPKVKYRIAVDAGYTATGREDGLWRTYFAHVDYEYVKDHYMTAGLFRVPFGVHNMTVGNLFQFTDRSLASWAHFSDRAIGMLAHGNLFERRLSYFAGVTNGHFNTHDSPSQDELDTNFGYVARLAYYALGKGNSLREMRLGYAQSDLAYSKDPELRFAGGFLFNDNNGDAGTGGLPGLYAPIPDRIRRGRGIGGTQLISDLGTQYYIFELDSGFKYRGLSLNVDYFLRTVDGEDEFSPWELQTGRSDSTHQQAGHFEAGYFIVPKRVEVIGRMGGIWDNGGDNVWEWGLGVNYFPWGTQNCRLTADFIRIAEAGGGIASAPNYSLNDELTMLRVILQVGF